MIIIHVRLRSEQISHKLTDELVCLPKPDRESIVAFTPELPNEPILPWRHFDSP